MTAIITAPDHEVPATTEFIAPKISRYKRMFPTVGVLLSWMFLLTLTFMAVFADYLPFIRSTRTVVKASGRSGVRFGFGPGFTAWFGTDTLGKDVFAKCIYGARVTLFVGVLATIIGLTIGGILGLAAGYFRGWVDRVVSILTDCLLALPPLLLAIILVFRLDDLKAKWSWISWLDRRWQITLTLGILAIAPLARIVRAQTLSLREREFVLAARSLGAKNGRIVVREILPNLIPTMMTVAFTGLGILIAAEGALAFLGLSVEIPTPTWGKLIDDNKNKIDVAWWAEIFPSLMLFLTVLAFSVIGDRLSRRFDIREAGV